MPSTVRSGEITALFHIKWQFWGTNIFKCSCNGVFEAGTWRKRERRGVGYRDEAEEVLGWWENLRRNLREDRNSQEILKGAKGGRNKCQGKISKGF